MVLITVNNNFLLSSNKNDIKSNCHFLLFLFLTILSKTNVGFIILLLLYFSFLLFFPFKECQVGWHGKDCKHMCTNFCLVPRVCDKITEHCIECPVGSYGAYCSKKCSPSCGNPKSCDKETGRCDTCPTGWYGQNCNMKCRVGNCVDPRTCDRTGGCSGGCKPGWKNLTCDTSKSKKNRCVNSFFFR